jgi:transposase-like protein
MSAKKKKTLEAALQQVRQAYHQRIVAELKSTEKSYRQIALDIGVSEGLVYLVNRLSRSRTEPEQMTAEKA